MKLIQPELTRISELYKEKSRRGDSAGAKKLMGERTELMRTHEINFMAAALNILQLPFYIFWFLGMRKIIYNPEAYDILSTNSLLWIPDILLPDPLYLVPLLSSIMTYLTIKKTMARTPMTAETPSFIRKFRPYMPYLPFPGTLFLIFMPASLNLYFFSLSFINYLITVFLQSNAYFYLAGIPKAFPGTILQKKLQEAEGQRILKANVVSSKSDLGSKTPSGKETVIVFTSKPKKNNLS